MSDKNFRCIAYLYNEMDPSERLEFERDLKGDENLLIEVETLRKVSDRLQNMESVKPPERVVEAVFNAAKGEKSPYRKRPERYLYLSAAAFLLLGLTFGFMLNGNTISEPATNSESASFGNISTMIPAATITGASAETGAEKMTPWVDQNDILHFRDAIQSRESASIDSIFRQSFQKLTPITNPTQSATARQNLHLTGSRR